MVGGGAKEQKNKSFLFYFDSGDVRHWINVEKVSEGGRFLHMFKIVTGMTHT